MDRSYQLPGASASEINAKNTEPQELPGRPGLTWGGEGGPPLTLGSREQAAPQLGTKPGATVRLLCDLGEVV